MYVLCCSIDICMFYVRIPSLLPVNILIFQYLLKTVYVFLYHHYIMTELLNPIVFQYHISISTLFKQPLTHIYWSVKIQATITMYEQPSAHYDVSQRNRRGVSRAFPDITNFSLSNIVPRAIDRSSRMTLN